MGSLNLYKNKVLQHKSNVLGMARDFEELNRLLRLPDDVRYPEYKGPKDNIIQKIKSRYPDMARTNLFSFQLLGIPTKLQGLNYFSGDFNLDMKFLIETCNLPQKRIDTLNVEYNGINRSFPNYYSFSDRPISINFYLDKSFSLYKMFNIWIAEITGRSTKGNHPSAIGLSYLDDISAIGRVTVFDLPSKKLDEEYNPLMGDNNKGIYYTDLTELFPIGISEINFDSREDDIQTFTVDFSFRDALAEETKDYHKPEFDSRGEYHTLNPATPRITLENLVDRIDRIRNVVGRFW